MSSFYRPKKVILNSRYRQQGERITNATYLLATPLTGVKAIKLSKMSFLYLTNLVLESQANLTYTSRRISDGFTRVHNVDLSSLTDVFYETVAELITDLSGAINSQVSVPDERISLNFDTQTKKLTGTIDASYEWIPNVGINQFWFNLGFDDESTYSYATSQTSPEYPNIIPFSQLYVEMGNIATSIAQLNTDKHNYYYNDSILMPITVSNTSFGAVFNYENWEDGDFTILNNAYLQQINIRLLNRIGQEVSLKSNYQLELLIDY